VDSIQIEDMISFLLRSSLCFQHLLVPKQMHKGLSTAALLVPWMIWKQRNSCVFEGAQASISNTLQLIKEEAMQWARAGALGLRTLLPQTWDVH
jgi:hypothetical protein